MSCTPTLLTPARVVAVATDTYLNPTHPFPDPANLPGGHVPRYGQDLTFGVCRSAPHGHNVGGTEAELKPKMEKLLGVFASADKSGKARRLFDKFLAKQRNVTYFDDNDLSVAAQNHPNIQYFVAAALSLPGTSHANSGKTRIHQALRNAGWDITKLTAPTDLGVPAFNKGSKVWKTEDFSNGLGLMINGVQHVYVVATHYRHDPAAGRYCITLKYYFYDVFGLDDDDLNEYGSKSDGWFSSDAGVGITAWWQLQHTHGYAPLVTRIVLSHTIEVPTT
jgi:hypothetical protein